jgi:hypothetical protein
MMFRISLTSKYTIVRNIWSWIHSLYFSAIMRDSVSPPYKIVCKIVALRQKEKKAVLIPSVLVYFRSRNERGRGGGGLPKV